MSDDPLSSVSQLEAEGSDEKSLILHALLYFLINHFAALLLGTHLNQLCRNDSHSKSQYWGLVEVLFINRDFQNSWVGVPN